MSDLMSAYAMVQKDRYDLTLKEVVASLHDLADRLAREGTPSYPGLAGDGLPDYLTAARNAVAVLHWGIPNAGIDELLRAAADAHSAVRGRVK